MSQNVIIKSNSTSDFVWGCVGGRGKCKNTKYHCIIIIIIIVIVVIVIVVVVVVVVILTPIM